MTPHVNDATVRDRIYQPLAEGARRRLARVARERRRARQHRLLEAVGHRLIAIGTRLVDSDPMPDPSQVDQAA